MSNKDEKKVFLKMIELTKEGKITWDYLDNFENVYEKLLIKPRSPLQSKNPLETLEQFSTIPIRREFDSDNSFVVCINDNYLVLCVWIDDVRNPKVLADRLILEVVPRTFKDVSVYSDDEDGDLVQLQTLVKSKFPNTEDIINDILNM